MRRDLDPNLGVGSFRFDPGDRPATGSSLQPGEPPMFWIDRNPSFESPAPHDSTADPLEELSFEFFLDQGVSFAISWTDGIAYYWSSEL